MSENLPATQLGSVLSVSNLQLLRFWPLSKQTVDTDKIGSPTSKLADTPFTAVLQVSDSQTELMAGSEYADK